MIDDLTVHNQLVGLNYHQLIERLVAPDNIDCRLVRYKIVVKYGSEIDPVYIQDFRLSYYKDSTIPSFKIVEWK